MYIYYIIYVYIYSYMLEHVSRLYYITLYYVTLQYYIILCYITLHYTILYYSILNYVCIYIYMLEHASWFLYGLVYISKTYPTHYIHHKVVYYLLFFSCPGPDVGRCKTLFLLDVAFFLSNILVSIHKIGRWLCLRVDNRTCSCHYFELSNKLGWGGVLTSFVVRTFNYVIDFSNILHGVRWGGVLTSFAVRTFNYIIDFQLR